MKTIYYLLIIFCSLNMEGQVSVKQRRAAHQIRISVDNDALNQRDVSDRYYTNGIRLSYITSGKMSDWSVLNWFLLSTPNQTHAMNGVELGQEMYTPKIINSTKVDSADRPFAGYTYLKLKRVSNSRDKSFRISSSFAFGYVGPKSGAKQVQTWFHGLTPFGGDSIGLNPIGWNYRQIPNKFIWLDYEINLERRLLDNFFSYDKGKPLHPNFDVIPAANVRIGQVINMIGIGSIIKLGWFNNHFASTTENYEPFYLHKYSKDKRIAELLANGEAYSAWQEYTRHGRYRRAQLFLFAKPSIDMIATNSFIQGAALFNKSKRKSLIPGDKLNRLVPYVEFGAHFNYGTISARASSCFVEPEFKGAKTHHYTKLELNFLW